ncbi:MAG: lasso peptide biosynthesis B2 protein [Egibacteraceae bacterium]
MSSLRIVERGVRLRLRHRPAALVAVGAARVLAQLPPRRIRGVLTVLRRGAMPATYQQTSAARDAVVAASVLCAGEGCLQRALATTLLCRLRGVWPTWCTGVRTAPFVAHAWVEVDGEPVDEPHPANYYRPIITIPPDLRRLLSLRLRSACGPKSELGTTRG